MIQCSTSIIPVPFQVFCFDVKDILSYFNVVKNDGIFFQYCTLHNIFFKNNKKYLMQNKKAMRVFHTHFLKTGIFSNYVMGELLIDLTHIYMYIECIRMPNILEKSQHA